MKNVDESKGETASAMFGRFLGILAMYQQTKKGLFASLTVDGRCKHGPCRGHVYVDKEMLISAYLQKHWLLAFRAIAELLESTIHPARIGENFPRWTSIKECLSRISYGIISMLAGGGSCGNCETFLKLKAVLPWLERNSRLKIILKLAVVKALWIL